mgnify:CR=1 FL=1
MVILDYCVFSLINVNFIMSVRKNIPGDKDKKLSIKQKKELKLDWDERPSSICPKCGYHKDSCVCSIQKPLVVDDQKIDISIDFY